MLLLGRFLGIVYDIRCNSLARSLILQLGVVRWNRFLLTEFRKRFFPRLRMILLSKLGIEGARGLELRLRL